MLVVIALAIALSAPAAARARSFADPGARVFTLSSHAEVSAIAALTGGDVVYALTGDPPDGRPGRLMRVTADGRRYTVRGDGARLLAAEGEHSVLRIPQEGSSVERVDTLTGEVSRLPALPRAAAVDALTALADGTAILATNQGVFAITPDERAMKLRAVASGDFPQWGLAPLGGQRFAFPRAGGLVAVDALGTREELASGPFSAPVAASGDGGVLATQVVPFATPDGCEDMPARAVCVRPTATPCSDWDGQDTVTVVRVGPDGAVTRPLTAAPRPSAALGDGDGLLLDGEEFGDALAVASDGTLLFVDSHRALRALVPPDSARPRIVLTQGGFSALRDGRLRFWASQPGALTATVRRGRADVVAAHGKVAVADDGDLALGHLPPGRYVVRLRLTTPSGGIAKTL